jgi:hypothetical protein
MDIHNFPLVLRQKPTTLISFYYYYGETQFPYLHPEDGNRKILLNLGTNLQHNIAKFTEDCWTLKQYIPSKLLVTSYQTGRCFNPYDQSIDIFLLLKQIEISASVKCAYVSRRYFGHEHCLFWWSKYHVPRHTSASKIVSRCYSGYLHILRILLTADCNVFALDKYVAKSNV